MRRVTIVVAVLISVVAMSQAQGHLLWHHDPKGDAAFDDIVDTRLSTFWHGGVKMLRANADFTSHDPYDDCCYSIRFLFDSRGDRAPDYVARIHADSGSCGIFDARLRRVGEGFRDVDVHVTGSECGGERHREYYRLPVWFKMGALHATRHIRWRVETATDQVPDHGWFTS